MTTPEQRERERRKKTKNPAASAARGAIQQARTGPQMAAGGGAAQTLTPSAGAVPLPSPRAHATAGASPEAVQQANLLSQQVVKPQGPAVQAAQALIQNMQQQRAVATRGASPEAVAAANQLAQQKPLPSGYAHATAGASPEAVAQANALAQQQAYVRDTGVTPERMERLREAPGNIAVYPELPAEKKPPAGVIPPMKGGEPAKKLRIPGGKEFDEANEAIRGVSRKNLPEVFTAVRDKMEAQGVDWKLIPSMRIAEKQVARIAPEQAAQSLADEWVANERAPVPERDAELLKRGIRELGKEKLPAVMKQALARKKAGMPLRYDPAGAARALKGKKDSEAALAKYHINRIETLIKAGEDSPDQREDIEEQVRLAIDAAEDQLGLLPYKRLPGKIAGWKTILGGEDKKRPALWKDDTQSQADMREMKRSAGEAVGGVTESAGREPNKLHYPETDEGDAAYAADKQAYARSGGRKVTRAPSVPYTDWAMYPEEKRNPGGERGKEILRPIAEGDETHQGVIGAWKDFENEWTRRGKTTEQCANMFLAYAAGHDMVEDAVKLLASEGKAPALAKALKKKGELVDRRYGLGAIATQIHSPTRTPTPVPEPTPAEAPTPAPEATQEPFERVVGPQEGLPPKVAPKPLEAPRTPLETQPTPVKRVDRDAGRRKAVEEGLKAIGSEYNPKVSLEKNEAYLDRSRMATEFLAEYEQEKEAKAAEYQAIRATEGGEHAVMLRHQVGSTNRYLQDLRDTGYLPTATGEYTYVKDREELEARLNEAIKSGTLADKIQASRALAVIETRSKWETGQFAEREPGEPLPVTTPEGDKGTIAAGVPEVGEAAEPTVPSREQAWTTYETERLKQEMKFEDREHIVTRTVNRFLIDLVAKPLLKLGTVNLEERAKIFADSVTEPFLEETAKMGEAFDEMRTDPVTGGLKYGGHAAAALLKALYGIGEGILKQTGPVQKTTLRKDIEHELAEATPVYGPGEQVAMKAASFLAFLTKMAIIGKVMGGKPVSSEVGTIKRLIQWELASDEPGAGFTYAMALAFGSHLKGVDATNIARTWGVTAAESAAFIAMAKSQGGDIIDMAFAAAIPITFQGLASFRQMRATGRLTKRSGDMLRLLGPMMKKMEIHYHPDRNPGKPVIAKNAAILHGAWDAANKAVISGKAIPAWAKDVIVDLWNGRQPKPVPSAVRGRLIATPGAKPAPTPKAKVAVKARPVTKPKPVAKAEVPAKAEKPIAVKRSKRNIGKRVRILEGQFAGRLGTVKGFRGSVETQTDVPWVQVFVDDMGDIQPISSRHLEYVTVEKAPVVEKPVVKAPAPAVEPTPEVPAEVAKLSAQEREYFDLIREIPKAEQALEQQMRREVVTPKGRRAKVWFPPDSQEAQLLSDIRSGGIRYGGYEVEMKEAVREKDMPLGWMKKGGSTPDQILIRAEELGLVPEGDLQPVAFLRAFYLSALKSAKEGSIEASRAKYELGEMRSYAAAVRADLATAEGIEQLAEKMKGVSIPEREMELADVLPDTGTVPKNIRDVEVDPLVNWPEKVAAVGKDYWIAAMAAAKALQTPYRYKELRSALGVHKQAKGIQLTDVTQAFTATHELGHDVDWRMNQKIFPSSIKGRFPETTVGERVLRKELQAVSQRMRPMLWEQEEVKGKPWPYIRRHTELMADFFAGYVLDPEWTAKTAPNVFKAYESAIAKNPRLAKTIGRLRAARTEGAIEPVGAEYAKKRFPLSKEPSAFLGEFLSKDYQIQAEELGLERERQHRAQIDEAVHEGERIRKSVPDRERRRDLLVVAENAKKNPWTGKLRAEIDAQGTTKSEQKHLDLYRGLKEKTRQTVNKMMRGVGIAEHIKFIEDYVIHAYETPMTQKYRSAITKWAKSSPQAKKRVLPTLVEAVEMGLEPRAQTLDEAHVLWAEINYRVATNIAFLKQLPKIVNETGESVVQSPKSHPDWPTVDYWPIRKVYAMPLKGRGVMLWQGRVAIDPKVLPIVKAIFDRPFAGKLARSIAAVNALAKGMELTILSGFHHQAEYFSAIGAAGHMALGTGVWGEIAKEMGGKRLFGIGPYRIGFRKLGQRLMDIPEIRRDMIMSGLGLGRKPIEVTNMIERSLQETEDLAGRASARHRILGKPAEVPRVAVKGIRLTYVAMQKLLWDNVTRAKAASYYMMVSKYIQQTDLPTKRVKEIVAQYLNNNFGGQEWLSTKIKNPKLRWALSQLLMSLDWTYGQIKTLGWAFGRGLGLRNAAERRLARKIGMRHWLRYLAGIGGATILLNYLFVGKPPWENEPGQRTNVDWTPVWRGLNDAFAKATGGQNWEEEGDLSRRYLGIGKAGREVFRYFYDPLQAFGNKLSPVAKELFKQTTGHTPGSTWAEPWVREDLELHETIWERFKSVMEMFKPFAFSGNNAFLAFPSRKGMTRWKAVKAYGDIYSARMKIAAGGWGGKLTKVTRVLDKDADHLMLDIAEACKVNSVDSERARKAALAGVRSKAYWRYWDACGSRNVKKANAMAEALKALEVTEEGLWKNLRRRRTTMGGKEFEATRETMEAREAKDTGATLYEQLRLLEDERAEAVATQAEGWSIAEHRTKTAAIKGRARNISVSYRDMRQKAIRGIGQSYRNRFIKAAGEDSKEKMAASWRVLRKLSGITEDSLSKSVSNAVKSGKITKAQARIARSVIKEMS